MAHGQDQLVLISTDDEVTKWMCQNPNHQPLIPTSLGLLVSLQFTSA